VEAVSGREIARVAHQYEVSFVEWSPDGRWLATGSRNEARVVEAATGREIARTAHEDRVSSLRWSPDGRWLATGAWDNTARVADLARKTKALAVPQVGNNERVPLIAGLYRPGQSSESLVLAAKERATRCLTQAQRKQHSLPPAPPVWCIERRLWPYHSDKWQRWLSLQQAWLASGRRGPQPALP